MGPIVETFGRYHVTDDGVLGARYSIRESLGLFGTQFVAGGTTLEYARLLACLLSIMRP